MLVVVAYEVMIAISSDKSGVLPVKSEIKSLTRPTPTSTNVGNTGGVALPGLTTLIAAPMRSL